MGGDSIMAKLIQLGCSSGCCDCDCDRLVTPQPPNIGCGCKYRVNFTGSFTSNYINPEFENDGCGIVYHNSFGSISKGSDIIFYGGTNGLEGEAGVVQECKSGYSYRVERCDGDGDEKCCNGPESSLDLCLITVVKAAGCNQPQSCSFSGGIDTYINSLGGTSAYIKATIKPSGGIEVNNLFIAGFSGPATSGTAYPVNVSFPGGSQQVLVAATGGIPYANEPGNTVTFSGNVSIT
jgi:hypothetical protein